MGGFAKAPNKERGMGDVDYLISILNITLRNKLFEDSQQVLLRLAR